jgi:hypothetical protein
MRCETGLVAAIVGMGLVAGGASAQDKEQRFGAFVAKCQTTQERRSCQVNVAPATGFYSDNGVLPFVIQVYPDETDIFSSNGIRLKLDQQEFVEGECKGMVCEYKNIGGIDTFIKGLETANVLHVEASTYRAADKGTKKLLDFDLNDYRKALAAYKEMRGPGTAGPAVNTANIADGKKIYGNFQADCKTDRMTDLRTCEVRLSPPTSFFVSHGIREAFLVFVRPDELSLDGVGFTTMLRVDKNPAIAGDCSTASVGPCKFPKPEKFIQQLATGKTMLVQVGAEIYEFDLDDYRKALAAYHEMKGPAPK